MIVGCDGSFRFDESARGARDGGAETDANDMIVGWEIKSCSPQNCVLTCQETTICQGSCGSLCSARCERGSHCTLTAADNADLLCQGGAVCALSPATSAIVTCQASSTCHVHCVGGCSLRCEAGATCDLQCGSAPIQTVAGTVACPAL